MKPHTYITCPGCGARLLVVDRCRIALISSEIEGAGWCVRIDAPTQAATNVDALLPQGFTLTNVEFQPDKTVWTIEQPGVNRPRRESE